MVRVKSALYPCGVVLSCGGALYGIRDRPLICTGDTEVGRPGHLWDIYILVIPRRSASVAVGRRRGNPCSAGVWARLPMSAAHNPVAGSNPAPATPSRPRSETWAFRLRVLTSPAMSTGFSKLKALTCCFAPVSAIDVYRPAAPTNSANCCAHARDEVLVGGMTSAPRWIRGPLLTGVPMPTSAWMWRRTVFSTCCPCHAEQTRGTRGHEDGFPPEPRHARQPGGPEAYREV
jgi:hypothetical protein